MIIALAGGVGGAKLAKGLAAILPPEKLLVVVNTGDDFEHLGLSISPDIDTVMYTLAGRADPDRGWGLAGETWNFMAALELVGGETWFQLGDRDLATHLQRTTRLGRGETLSEVTAHLCRCYGVSHRVVPMSDDEVRTVLHTREGVLAFQDYFVRRRCEPAVTGIEFRGAATANPSAAFDQALGSKELEAIIICPSNPLLSIGPILALSGIRARLASLNIPRIAISPIIQGQAVKGPAAKIMRELGREPSAVMVAEMYGNAVNGMVIEECDRAQIERMTRMGITGMPAPTVMKNDADQQQLARTVLQFAQSMRASLETASRNTEKWHPGCSFP